MSEPQQAAPEKPKQAEKKDQDPSTLEFLHDVSLEIAVELGRTDLAIERLIKLKKGSVIEIDKLSEEPLDVRVNGKLVARGEAVIVNEMFGIRITQVLTPMGEDLV